VGKRTAHGPVFDSTNEKLQTRNLSYLVAALDSNQRPTDYEFSMHVLKAVENKTLNSERPHGRKKRRVENVGFVGAS
jgi:hypothetical protein